MLTCSRKHKRSPLSKLWSRWFKYKYICGCRKIKLTDYLSEMSPALICTEQLDSYMWIPVQVLCSTEQSVDVFHNASLPLHVSTRFDTWDRKTKPEDSHWTPPTRAQAGCKEIIPQRRLCVCVCVWACVCVWGCVCGGECMCVWGVRGVI